MKKILLILPILALVIAFLPQAQAGDQAAVKVMVKFIINHPPVWNIEPPAEAKVMEGNTLTIPVLAYDPDGGSLAYGCRYYLNGVRQDTLPEGADFRSKYLPPPYGGMENPKLTWNVPVGIDLSAEHVFEFTASEMLDGMPVEGGLSIRAKTLVTISPRIISIELAPSELALNVKLGEKASQIITLKNTGTIPVNIDAGYAPYDANGDGVIDDRDLLGIRPGLEPGIDVFATMLGVSVIPPNMRIRLDKTIGVGEAIDNPFTYRAPTGLSANVPEMHGFALDFRAWAQ